MITQVKDLIIFTDGGSRGNPGPSAAGVVIMDSNREVLEAFGSYLGIGTNNRAEYTALKLALAAAEKYRPTRIKCFMDSELVVRQLNGVYKVKNIELKPINAEIRRLAEPYEVSFEHVYREHNQLADKQVNLAIDEALATG
jgi:ribonuclease HI